MKTRLIGKGFINSITDRGGVVFAQVAVFDGSTYTPYSVVFDKSFLQAMRPMMDMAGGMDDFSAMLAKKPVVLCVANPKAAISSDGAGISYTGVLLGWCEVDTYKSGMADSKVFGVVYD